MDTINPWLDPSEVRHLAEQLMRPVAPARINAADPGFNDAFEGFTCAREKQEEPTVLEPTNFPPPSVAAVAPAAPVAPVAPVAPQQAQVVPNTAVEIAPAAESIPPAVQHKPEPEPLPQVPSKTRFLERIQIFRDWLVKNFKASEIFILDREGKVIFDESGHGRLHFMARNLASASKGSGNIHVKIGPSSILEVLPCDTPYGRIVLGTLVPEALPPHHVQTITQVLVQTASPA
ncbi:hypothetical protein [Luteolibacter sp. AS25]|uniref:hypothetical protein n=1 Tax=Luteolibacter sp. AS25 TaxID=3135776 RepID=UPI00398AA2D9